MQQDKADLLKTRKLPHLAECRIDITADIWLQVTCTAAGGHGLILRNSTPHIPFNLSHLRR
jgi:hypothetical protein